METTAFSRDVLGRCVCNTLDEALASTRGGASPFHHIVIGSGLFGGALASLLVDLDAGPLRAACWPARSGAATPRRAPRP